MDKLIRQLRIMSAWRYRNDIDSVSDVADTAKQACETINLLVAALEGLANSVERDICSRSMVYRESDEMHAVRIALREVGRRV
jgi:hypothetical protein